MPETETTDKKTNKERIKEIVAGIEDGIEKLFQSEKYFDYLRTMSRFHNYSVNNTVLIHLQKPNASLVAGFGQWKNKFGRHVKRGETGITIIAPTPFKKKVEEMKLDPDTNEPMYDKDGKLIMEERMIEIPMFKPVKVFDVSQTDGKPLPQLSADLVGDVQQYEAFMEALKRSAPVPIEFHPIDKSMDGYFSQDEQKIVVRTGMSQVQTVCAAVHEIGHSVLHNREQTALTAAAGTDKEPAKPKDKNTMEVEAESVSYAVCAYYGIETGSNSFGYIASWSKDKTLPELRASLETITKTANTLINGIDKNFAEICKERGITLSERAEPSGIEAQAPETKAPEPDMPAPETKAPEPDTPAPEPKAPEPDTPERFSVDFCNYLDQLYQDGTIENPFSAMSKEELTPEITKVLQNGMFDGARETLTQVLDRTHSPVAASLLERLDKLTAQWEASLTYTVEDYPLSTGELDKSAIFVYKPTDPKHEGGSVIFVGPTEKCQELTQKLSDGAITRNEVKELDRLRPEEAKLTEAASPAAEAPPAAEQSEIDTTLDEYPVPDESMRDVDLAAYGYTDGDMHPLSIEKAKELLEKDYSVYTIVDGGEAELCFDAEDIEARPVDAVFAVPCEEWEQGAQFNEAVNTRMDRQEQREQAFLNHKADCFAIYQVKHTDDLRFIRYESVDSLRKQGKEPERANYDLVYTGPLPAGATLDTLWEKFNKDHPADYRRPSMSVSDIVALKQDGVVSSFYVDSFGFAKLPDFLEKENYLKNAELMLEDDANMIDGIINNGPKQPTVAELEAQVQAGQTISMLDLANAVQAENRQKEQAKQKRDPAKRPSIMARLNAAPPKQQNKQKQAPKRSAERDR